jgi:hypothetical protein
MLSSTYVCLQASHTPVCLTADIRAKGELGGKKISRASGTYLILDQELNTLDRSSCGLGDGGGDTTHCYRRSASIPYEIHCRKPHLSPPIESEGDNNRRILVKINLLKKSITKGGLSKYGSAGGSGDGIRNW